jgi:uncharacterized GH25 family protein
MKPLVCLLLSVPLCAHDLYLMPKQFRAAPGTKVLVSVHNGDAFPDSEGQTDPQRLRGTAAGGGSYGEFVALGKQTHGFATLAGSGTLPVAASTSPRTLEPIPVAKAEGYLKSEGLGHVIAWRAKNGEAAEPWREVYSKHAKTLLVSGAPGAGFDQPLGLPIEFLPASDPARLKPGMPLTVTLLWRGKPAADVQVEASWAAGGKNGTKVIGRTGADGRISLPLSTAGLWRLRAVAIERSRAAGPPSWESFWASLTFEVLAE